MLKITLFVLVTFVVATFAIPFEKYQRNSHHRQFDLFEVDSPVLIARHYNREKRSPAYEVYYPEELHRVVRSLQPGAPGVPNNPQQNGGGWSLNPDLGRDESGNTKGKVEVRHKGNNHDFNAGWGKVIRGPNKAKPTWHVGGTYRW